MKNSNPTFEHVSNLWDDGEAARLDPVDRLVYRSNLLGADQRITNTGGGNTSSKIMENDPLTGQPVEVLWVKGSGGDLRTCKRDNFSSLYQDKLIGLQKTLRDAAPTRARSRQAEDDMVGHVPARDLQPEPARRLDRHAAARFLPAQARRPHAPQRGHRGRRAANCES